MRNKLQLILDDLQILEAKKRIDLSKPYVFQDPAIEAKQQEVLAILKSYSQLSQVPKVAIFSDRSSGIEVWITGIGAFDYEQEKAAKVELEQFAQEVVTKLKLRVSMPSGRFMAWVKLGKSKR